MYGSQGLVTMKQIHAATGVPNSTLWQMVQNRHLIPAVPSSGRGQEALFHETAIQQVRAAWNVPEESVEATVTIRLVFDSQVGGRVPTTCCVCTRESEGVWICAGVAGPTPAQAYLNWVNASE